MSMNLDEKRHYRSSKLATFSMKTPSLKPGQKEILMMLYGEVCNNWGRLTDVRFKLLGFVPSVSVTILLTLLARTDLSNGLSTTTKSTIIIFGLLITIALFVYELRNSQLYDDLISRGRKIEEELGIDTGMFRGRLTPPHLLIKHDVAIYLIYFTSIAGWGVALFASFLHW